MYVRDQIVLVLKFYKRVLIYFKRISLLAEYPSTLSWLAEFLELRKGLIIWVA